MSDADPGTTGEPRRLRKRWIVLGFTIVFLAAWGSVFFHDGAPPDDADLRLPSPAKLPDAENAAVAWRQAPRLGIPFDGLWNVLPWVESPPFLEAESNPTVAGRLESADRWLRENRDALDARANALARPGYAPDPGLGIPYDVMASLSAFDVAAAIRFADGDFEDAWRWTEIASEWHRRLFDHPLAAMPFLLTNQSRPIGIARLRLAQLAPDDAAQLEACLATTDRCELPPDWRKGVFLRAYETYVEYVGADAERWKQLENRKMPPPSWAQQFHRPNRSRRLYVDFARRVVRALDAGVTSHEKLTEITAAIPDTANPLERWLHFATGNAGGVYLIDRYFFLPEDLVDADTTHKIEFCHAATRTLLALRLHRARHGEWPATLEELVPEVLPELPLDPDSPDRAPLRYDPAREVLFGVGENGIDDGGDIPDRDRGLLLLEGDDRIVPLVHPSQR